MAPLTAKIHPEIKQTSGGADYDTERASHEDDDDGGQTLHSQRHGQPAAPKQGNRHTLEEIDG
jgi:hypothetical protein